MFGDRTPKPGIRDAWGGHTVGKKQGFVRDPGLPERKANPYPKVVEPLLPPDRGISNGAPDEKGPSKSPPYDPGDNEGTNTITGR